MSFEKVYLLNKAPVDEVERTITKMAWSGHMFPDDAIADRVALMWSDLQFSCLNCEKAGYYAMKLPHLMRLGGRLKVRPDREGWNEAILVVTVSNPSYRPVTAQQGWIEGDGPCDVTIYLTSIRKVADYVEEQKPGVFQSIKKFVEGWGKPR